jgi:hypothetical protein
MGEMPNGQVSEDLKTVDTQTEPSGSESPSVDAPTVEEMQKQIAELSGKLKDVTSESIERRKLLKKHEEQAKTSEESKLVEQNQWQQLAEQREAEMSALTTSIKEQNLSSALKDALIKEGVQVDFLDGALKLLNRDGVVYDDESGTVHGATETVAQLKKSYAPFFAKPAPVKTVTGNESPTFGDPSPSMTHEELGKLSSEQIIAYYKKRQ